MLLWHFGGREYGKYGKTCQHCRWLGRDLNTRLTEWPDMDRGFHAIGEVTPRIGCYVT
jgi:hypothetical protein